LHLSRVLRLKLGETVRLLDGVGGMFEGEIQLVHQKNSVVGNLRPVEIQNQRPYYLHIAIAPTKMMERFEWFLEKATEIGIDEITLIQTKHSERKNQKTERLEKIAISAMKQSLKAYLPKVNELMDFNEFIQNANFEAKFLAHLTDDAKPLKDVAANKKEVLLMIGPEGDFSQDEILLAQNIGFQLVTLGNSRLRTETAGVVACSIVNAFK
jgi:16S rRNA (uracil1498-N3)-methyltransferase